jgi:hypothetical protein
MSKIMVFPSGNIENSEVRGLRFDLYRLPRGGRYVVDVQSDHASAKVNTRVVAPLLKVDILRLSRALDILMTGF